MVVVSTMREPGVAGSCEDAITHELIPTVPRGTVVDVVVLVLAGVVVVVVGAVVVAGAGAIVVAGAVVAVVLSMDMAEESALNNGPALPAESFTAFAASRAITVPSEVHVTETVMLVPETELGVNEQPLAVPLALLKSPEAIPLTDSLNASV
jgi:hypothetical protein